MRACSAACFRNWRHLSPLHYLGRWHPLPPPWHSHFFRYIRVPNFGASPPRSPGQSRGHTLLPERPRMPAKGFIEDDWTNGKLEGGGWAKSKKKQPWQHQRLRLEEGSPAERGEAVGSAWKRWSLSFQSSTRMSSWASHKPCHCSWGLHFAPFQLS